MAASSSSQGGRPAKGEGACCSGWRSWLAARREKPLEVKAGHAAVAKSPGDAAAGGANRAGGDRADEGRAILRGIFAIERRCLGEAVEEAEDNMAVECMMDEEERRYFLCSSLASPIVIAYFWLRFPDVHMADVRMALVDAKERQARDHDSEYTVIQPVDEEDPTRQEAVSYVLRVPWPFSDREILQRRWQLALGGEGEGLAIVMRSFEDEEAMPKRADRVRAWVPRAAYLLRPLGCTGGDAAAGATASSPEEAIRQAEDAPGLELVVCQQIDIGGLCPAWAQRFLTRFAVQSALDWAKKLREHCLHQHAKRRGIDVEPPTTMSRDPSNSALVSRSKLVEMSGQEVLEAILAIERRCCHEDGRADGLDGIVGDGSSEPRLAVECLLDEAAAKYCLCCSLDSPVVIGYIRVLLEDVYPGDVWRALVATEERLLRDPASEYEVLRKAKPGDATCQEDIYYVWRAPWPFWDRDVLQRRWTFPLHQGEGLAIVMRSIEDDDLRPECDDKVRACVQKCGYLLRPLQQKAAEAGRAWNGAGLELTVCQQVDLGGLCPDWAQELLTRWAVNRGVQWAEDLREHCRQQHKLRAECGEPEVAPPENSFW